MPHRIDYSGKRARIQIDLNGASLDADANPIGADWLTLKNVLTDLPGVLSKRGAILNAGANSTDINDASGAMAFYDGVLRAGATYRPYVGVCKDGSSTDVFVQTEASSRVTMYASAAYGVPVSKCPTVDGWLVLCGRDHLSATYPNQPAHVLLYAGSVYSTASTYSTGTVTVTTSSAVVTGSGTTWTSAMEGMIFSNGGDTINGTYIVKKVVSTTSLTLDKPYTGADSGAGKSYMLYRVNALDALSSDGFSGYPRFRVATSFGGRLFAGYTKEGSSDVDTDPDYPSRIRWSGVAGSDEGAGSAIGLFAWNADGFIDLASRFGAILALAPYGDALLSFQESGLTVLRGAPVYDGAGSLDASEVHPGVAINGGFAFEATPQGVFFFDKNVGPCVYDGSRVQRLGDARVTRTMLPYGIKHVGYYDGKVLYSGETLPGIFVFDTATSQWSLQVPPAAVTCLIAGRVENDEDVVGLGGGTQVVNLANMFDAPGVASTDWDGTAFVVDLKTGKIGDALTQLRPERMWVTYRLTDLAASNPYLAATLTTGMKDTPGTEQTYTSASTVLTETTDPETRVLEIQMDRDPMTQLRILQNNAAGKLEIYSIVIDCAVEGEGPG